YDYLLAQLDAFATGSRSEATGTMQRVAQAMSADDRAAVAAYLASLSPARQ
ncbi:cytochrome c, partial [Burkholderia sp. E168m23]